MTVLFVATFILAGITVAWMAQGMQEPGNIDWTVMAVAFLAWPLIILFYYLVVGLEEKKTRDAHVRKYKSWIKSK